MTNETYQSSLVKENILSQETTKAFKDSTLTHETSNETQRKISFPEVVDSTILGAFTDCPLKAFREYCLKLGSPTPSIHLHAGGAFARALEVTRRGRWEQGLTFEESLEQAFKEFVKYWGEFDAPDFGSGANKTFERMWQAVECYFEEYPLDSDPIRPFIFDDGRTGIEFTFGIPLPVDHPDTGNPIIYGGRTDLLGYYRDMPAVIDEKTTSSLGSSWADKWKLRGQFIGYVWAAQQSGIPVNNALVRGISILKTKFGHIEVPLTYSKHLIKRWYLHMLRKVASFVAYYEVYKEEINSGYDVVLPEDIWPMAFNDACTAYGGCMFTDLCLSPNPEQWYGDFPERVWNPLEKNPNEFKIEQKQEEQI